LTKGQNVLCISNEIIEEYVEILERLFNHSFAEAVVKTIVNSPFLEYVAPFYKFELIKSDPDDNKFVDCAIAANARYIVSNDRHYDVLKTINFPRVEVLSLSSFANLIK
jgi:predicted nucleic acid-binding protein